MIETMGPMRNPLRKVSCGGEQQKRQAGQEPIGEKFPAAVPGRAENYLGTVSFRNESQKRHAR